MFFTQATAPFRVFTHFKFFWQGHPVKRLSLGILLEVLSSSGGQTFGDDSCSIFLVEASWEFRGSFGYPSELVAFGEGPYITDLCMSLFA